jgi:hypothetical protein
MEEHLAVTSISQSTWLMIGFGLLIIIGIYVLYHVTASSSYATMQRAVLTMGVYPKVMDLSPLGCPTSDDSRLCDYYMASSSYSVFPSSYVYDYVSDAVLPPVIKAGARLIELDIYADANDKPIVGLKNEKMGYDYAKNSVSFESCCVSVANTAFNKVETKAASDPFVLSLMFHTNKTNVIDACAEILKQTVGRYLLGPEYAFEGQGKINLAVEPICNLAGKLIIVSGGEVKGSHSMMELVNLSWDSSNLRRISYMTASQPYDHEELINSNRRAISMVVPDPDPDLKNGNPIVLFGYGCQWIMMNYGSLDSMMELYIGKFQQGSMLLKPSYLRYKPSTYKTPVLPPPEHSFQPMAASSPIYDKNPLTGDKSIVI